MVTKNTYLNSKGQALLFVIVVMTIALAVGVAVSTRTLSSLRRTATTDTSTRVYTATEGGIEWFLQQPKSVLDALADGNNNGGTDCPVGTEADGTEACAIIYPPNTSDPVTSQASVTVDTFQYNSPSGTDHYWFMLNPGEVKEVETEISPLSYFRGGIEVCWTSQVTNQSTGIYYMTYTASAVTRKDIISPNITQGTYDVDGGVVASSGHDGYANCYTVNTGSANWEGIRFKSLYAPSKVAIFPHPNVGSSFPVQGYKITSVGSLVQDGVTKVSKTLIVYKSHPYLPAVFDYSIYSGNDLD